MTVVIAGAGPTGLTLACELTRRGIACRVLDKAPDLFPGSRGKGLSPRTQEVFDDLGIAPAINSGGMAMPPFRIYAGHEVVAERSLVEMLGTDIPLGPRHPIPRFLVGAAMAYRRDPVGQAASVRRRCGIQL